MNRKDLVRSTHCFSEPLNIDDPTYKQWVFRYTFLELEKDLTPNGDITSDYLFAGGDVGTVSVFAKSDGVFAGGSEILYFLVNASRDFRPRIVGDFEVELFVEDGDEFVSGDKLCSISGQMSNLLAVERVVMNLLTRMSSVATYARSVVDMVKEENVLIVPTRKTLWGLLDKRAVLIGGGGTHRLNLSDAIMVKDNHLDFWNGDFSYVFKNLLKSRFTGRFFEIEVRSFEEFSHLLEAIRSEDVLVKLQVPLFVLFDNFEPEEVRRTVMYAESLGMNDGVYFEVSGGITPKNILAYAKTGVDVVSMGCLTGAVPTVDLSMRY